MSGSSTPAEARYLQIVKDVSVISQQLPISESMRLLQLVTDAYNAGLDRGKEIYESSRGTTIN